MYSFTFLGQPYEPASACPSENEEANMSDKDEDDEDSGENERKSIFQSAIKQHLAMTHHTTAAASESARRASSQQQTSNENLAIQEEGETFTTSHADRDDDEVSNLTDVEDDNHQNDGVIDNSERDISATIDNKTTSTSNSST